MLALPPQKTQSSIDPSKDLPEEENLEWSVSVENDEGCFFSAGLQKMTRCGSLRGLPSAGVVLKGNKKIGWTEVELPENTPLLDGFMELLKQISGLVVCMEAFSNGTARNG